MLRLDFIRCKKVTLSCASLLGLLILHSRGQSHAAQNTTGSIEDLILCNVASTAGSLLVSWMDFLNGGAHLALSIATALAASGEMRTLGRIKLFHGART